MPIGPQMELPSFQQILFDLGGISQQRRTRSKVEAKKRRISQVERLRKLMTTTEYFNMQRNTLSLIKLELVSKFRVIMQGKAHASASCPPKRYGLQGSQSILLYTTCTTTRCTSEYYQYSKIFSPLNVATQGFLC